MSKSHTKLSILHWVLVLAFFAGASFLVEKNATDFQASVIPTKQAPAYDGLALPILKSPNWVELSSAQWKSTYNEIPADKLLPLPVYDPQQLKIPVQQLTWSKADKIIRNAKITHTTAYMGNYKLDGIEYAGSHLAVDIKIPELTPIYAIGNGIVVKVSKQSSGFGNHIVVKHENFPSFDNPNVKTTYYSSYNHMNSISVSEGDIVLRGQQIGLSGHSGDATTPHLHFQIDNDQAPWHPYWPFTYSEANAAGLDFGSAVDAGLGKDKALATTINPMLYVQKYLSSQPVSSSVSNSSPAPSPVPTPSLPPPVVTPSPAVTTPPVVVPAASPASPSPVVVPPSTPQNSSSDSQTSTDSTPPPAAVPEVAPDNSSDQQVEAQVSASSFKVLGDDSFVVGVSEMIKVQAVDEHGNVVKGYKPQDGVSIAVENGSANILQNYLSVQDFTNGEANFSVIPTGKQGLRLKANDGKISGESAVLQSSIFSDVATNTNVYSAVSFLKNYDVISGYPDGSFKPDNVVSRVEALKFIVKSSKKLSLQKATTLPFKDTNIHEWYADYIATAYANRIVKGYGDSTFKPAQVVSRAEFLKMLLLAMDIQPPMPVKQDVFDDVKSDTWYAPYVAYAKDKNLIETSSNLYKPAEGMKRDEVADLIYRIVVLQLRGQSKFNAGLVVTDTQAQKYFAGHNG